MDRYVKLSYLLHRRDLNIHYIIYQIIYLSFDNEFREVMHY